MKMKILAALLCGIIATAQAKTVTVAIDLSGSNPLLSHQNFAHGAAQYVHQEVEQLKEGDEVAIRSFGARGNTRNLLSQRYVITRRLRASQLAEAFASHIRGLPSSAESGQASTNLIAWLELTGGLACERGGRVIVITDGLESSTVVDGKSLLSGKAKLPAPEVNLQGCNVTFYGLGAGWEYGAVRHLRSEWKSWFEKAGAEFSAFAP